MRLAALIFALVLNSFAEAKGLLTGTWRLVRVETIRPNGEVIPSFLGKNPRGIIMYLPNGFMSVQITGDPPARTKGPFEEASDAEKKAVAEGYYAYYGRYEVDEKKGAVTHHVEASLRPHEVGIDYVRYYKLQGDSVTLETAPRMESGEMRVNRLVWRRAN